MRRRSSGVAVLWILGLLLQLKGVRRTNFLFFLPLVVVEIFSVKAGRVESVVGKQVLLLLLLAGCRSRSLVGGERWACRTGSRLRILLLRGLSVLIVCWRLIRILLLPLRVQTWIRIRWMVRMRRWPVTLIHWKLWWWVRIRLIWWLLLLALKRRPLLQLRLFRFVAWRIV